MEKKPIPSINLGFWADIIDPNKPILALAPMADVTDAAFRRIIAKYSRMGKPAVIDKKTRQILRPAGGPDVLWTEFVSADGLFLAPPEGRAKLMLDLLFTEAERPIVAQFFTSKPEMMERAAYLAGELGFDGIDINMGCPDRSIEKQGAGAALMKNPVLAKELIRAAHRGAQKFADDFNKRNDRKVSTRKTSIRKMSQKSPLPVSVKTRIGYSKNDLATWLPALLEECLAVVTVHARTRRDLSEVPARWEHVREAVMIRDAIQGMNGTRTLIFGNGDVAGLGDARRKAVATGADGIMIGRAIFGNPWLFGGEKAVPLVEKLRVMVEHTILFEKLFGSSKNSVPKNGDSKTSGLDNERLKNFAVMKKHYKAYVNGFDGAAALRAKLMAANSAEEVARIVTEFSGR